MKDDSADINFQPYFQMSKCILAVIAECYFRNSMGQKSKDRAFPSSDSGTQFGGIVHG